MPGIQNPLRAPGRFVADHGAEVPRKSDTNLRRIGIIGGITWGATVDYYRRDAGNKWLRGVFTGLFRQS